MHVLLSPNIQSLVTKSSSPLNLCAIGKLVNSSMLPLTIFVHVAGVVNFSFGHLHNPHRYSHKEILDK